MMFSRTQTEARWRQPGAMSAVVATVALVLMLVPPRWFAAPRAMFLSALRPGQQAIAIARDEVGSLRVKVESVLAAGERLESQDAEIEALRAENRRLEAVLASAAERSNNEAADDEFDQSTEPLLLAESIEARVLGYRAQGLLERRAIVDHGFEAQIEPGNVVLDPGGRLIDLGDDHAVAPGDRILAGRTIWGQVVEVDRHVSLVRRVSAAGYRDLVQLGRREGGRTYLAARGVLEGTGEPLCRIRFIETTEPVAVGDQVYTVAGENVTDALLYYGEVVRVERAEGAAHWDIWMKPAAAAWPRDVTVVASKLNPARFGGPPAVANISTSR